MAENKKQTIRYIKSQTTTEIINGEEVYRTFPAPLIPAFPVLSWASLFSLPFAQVPSLFQSRQIHHFTAARYALYQALKEMGAKEKDEILVPAYHCKAMIYPILDAGCVPVFYKIENGFDSNIEDLKGLITNKTKAIIAVNYFGFIQNILSVRKVCDQYNLQLIEDCAHSMFGSSNNIAVGQTGDCAIGSTKKFFPVIEGGILTYNTSFPHQERSLKGGLKSEIRFIYNTIENALEYGRLWIFKPLIYLIEKLRGQNNTPDVHEDFHSSDNAQEEYSPNNKFDRPSRLSISLEKYIPYGRICLKRRENYLFLVNSLKKNPNITIPISEIPLGVVPYMLPVIIDNLDDIFPKIEDEGIPFQRFGQFLWQGSERCPISQEYAETILQLPCHQELSKSELQWIADKLKEIISKKSKN